MMSWLRSYMTDHYQLAGESGNSSTHTEVQFGVPQGSVLGPLLFFLYMVPLGNWN